jgi:opacity protein-like surface antigen
MSRRVIALAAIAAALVSAPVALEAQSPVKFGLAAGATFPTGDAADFVDWGYHVAGHIGVKPMASPVGFRGEVMWNRLTGKEFDAGELGTIDGPDVDVLAGIVNAELGLGGVAARPYLIGGLGMYRFSAEDVDSETDFGFNIGVGVDFALSGFNAFGEVRYHSIQTEGDATNIIPISFGIRF